MTITRLVPYPTPNLANFIAAADLSSYQYHFVKASSAVNEVTVCSAVTDEPIGILMNAPDAAGKEAEVALIGGGAKLYCDNTVTNGAGIKTDANGHGTLASAGRVHALALPMGSTTASGDVIPVIVMGLGCKDLTQATVVTALGTTTALTTASVTATALTTLAVTASTVTDSASIAAALDTKADNADVETLRTEVQTALLTKADNADVEVLRGEIEVRLDNLESKVDAILSSLKTAGVMASA